MIPRLSIDESELFAVPAVHNRCVFAEQVNRACQDESTRPDAIAVELSPEAVAGVVSWLKELGVGPGCGGKIPCMLGLVKTNRRIHPRHKEAALRLQELHGVPLHQVPPEILRRELNFAPVSLLCLSTTDSMIEAIRSALELDLPVYGVDLGDVANVDRGQPMIQDPILAQECLATYVQRNESPCGPHRDEIVDGRREWAMAARLKRLLRLHRRVLFTGGLGHWQQLRQLLSDDAFLPAVEGVQSEREIYSRVVVAPSLAVHQMDLFPDLTVHYESLRRLPPDAEARRMDFAAIYQTKLATAYECAEPKNREMAAAFAQYLTNLCLVQPCRVPDLFMTLNAARVMISPSFASRLGEVLVTQALDWARPEQWPNLPYLREVRSGTSESRFPNAGQQAEIEQQGKRSSPFYLSHLSESDNHMMDLPIPPLPEPGSSNSGPKRRNHFASSWVWPPCESLLFGTAYAAAEIADRNRRERIPEAFAGSLHDGVDIKATLRAIIRGERRVQVKVPSVATRMAIATEGGDEPTVFLFEQEETVKGGRWETLLAGDRHDIRKYVQDSARFDQVIGQKGDNFVVSVQFYADREPPESLRRHVNSLHYLYGIVVFGNPSLTPLQSARWLEGADYACCPIQRSSGVSHLFDRYRHEHNLALDWGRWASSLIRLALPYAKRRVMVVLPPGQEVPSQVHREASARRLSLELVPVSQFSAQRIEAIRHQYMVHPIEVNAMEYPAEMLAAFGESPREHLDLLPERIRAQLDLET